MRNLLALIGLLVVGGAGLGWYMGWYKLSFTKGNDGTLQIKTDVDTKKVSDDSATFFKNAATVVGSQLEKSAQEAKTSAPSGAPGGTPGPVVPAGGTPSAPNTPTAPVPPTVPVAPSNPTPGPITLFPPK